MVKIATDQMTGTKTINSPNAATGSNAYLMRQYGRQIKAVRSSAKGQAGRFVRSDHKLIYRDNFGVQALTRRPGTRD